MINVSFINEFGERSRGRFSWNSVLDRRRINLRDATERRQMVADNVCSTTLYPNVQELLDNSNIRMFYSSVERTIDVAGEEIKYTHVCGIYF